MVVVYLTEKSSNTTTVPFLCARQCVRHCGENQGSANIYAPCAHFVPLRLKQASYLKTCQELDFVVQDITNLQSQQDLTLEYLAANSRCNFWTGEQSSRILCNKLRLWSPADIGMWSRSRLHLPACPWVWSCTGYWTSLNLRSLIFE